MYANCACASIKGTHPEGRPLAAGHRKCCAGLFTPQAPTREAEAAPFSFLKKNSLRGDDRHTPSDVSSNWPGLIDRPIKTVFL